MFDERNWAIGDLCTAETKNVDGNVLYLVTEVIEKKMRWDAIVIQLNLKPVYEFTLNDHRTRQNKKAYSNYCEKISLERLLKEYAGLCGFIRTETRRLSGDEDVSNEVLKKAGQI